MKTLKNKILTVSMATALMCTASNLLGQDLAGRWYLGLDAGVALQQDITIEDTGGGKLSFHPGVRLGLSGGVHLSQAWRAELELGCIFNPVKSFAEGGSEGSDRGYWQVPMMANGIYRLPLRGPVSAYVGAGVGGVYGVLWEWLLAEDSFTFGYQGILGVNYALNDNLDVGLRYKFLGTVEHDLGGVEVDGSMSHSILAAVTFKF
jgi:opacity protein-like surface antigen